MNFAGCWQRAVLCAAAALLLGSWGLAQDPGEPKDKEKPKEKVKTAADKEFDKQVNAAIDKGVKYLRGLLGAGGGEGLQPPGAAPLVGLALLEAGVPPDDAAIRKVANFVRTKAIQDSYGYSVCTSIMFLDRLGDPQDEPFIEALAVRVLGGQIFEGAGQEGGWSYYARAPQPAEVKRLTECLKDRKEPGDTPAKAQPRTPKDLPKELLDQIEAIYQKGKGGASIPGGSVADNSNTQFALLALWVARRHGLPVERAFALSEKRLRSTQQAQGGWAYKTPSPGVPPNVETKPTAQMTCCGLIGLALGHGASTTKRKMSEDKAILNGLKAIAAVVGHPYSDPKDVPRFPELKADRLYYTLWSLERMAVLYDFPTIQGKDWYKWGAQILLANQSADGSWVGAYREGGCDTCFALLFLKRANIAADLTERIKKDPTLRPPLVEPIRDPAGKGDQRSPPKSSQGPRPGGLDKALWQPGLAREEVTRTLAIGKLRLFQHFGEKKLDVGTCQEENDFLRAHNHGMKSGQMPTGNTCSDTPPILPSLLLSLIPGGRTEGVLRLQAGRTLSPRAGVCNRRVCLLMFPIRDRSLSLSHPCSWRSQCLSAHC